MPATRKEPNWRQALAERRIAPTQADSRRAGQRARLGDQPTAIEELTAGLERGDKHQVLLGVTGSGKTFSMASAIARVNRPALILAHNKTLAAQLYQEFKSFFPNNAVEYFVSYYDYYQPEAYVPQSDTYIEKESTINDEIDRMRLSATRSLFERRDVVIVASVSCIYGLGSPEAYYGMLLFLRQGGTLDRREILAKLVEARYDRNDYELKRGTFRVRGDVIEIVPAYEETGVRIELFGDEIEQLSSFDPLTGKAIGRLSQVAIYPSTTRDAAAAARRRDQDHRGRAGRAQGGPGRRASCWRRSGSPAQCSTEMPLRRSATATASRTSPPPSSGWQPGRAVADAARLTRPRRGDDRESSHRGP
jgi:hypothetical protein